MRFVTIDFETYYGDDYTLTKLSTEDYVTDPRFEVILVGIKIANEQPYYITGSKKQIASHLHGLALQDCAVLCHNTMFDALILAVHFGIFPKMYCDTMCMAQAQLKPFTRSISLDSCLKHIDLGIQKGTEVHTMRGRTRQSLSSAELANYGRYCCDDVEGEFRLFRYLAPQVPKSELEVIDMTLRMYLQPCFLLDARILAENLADVRSKKAHALAQIGNVGQDVLMSNPKFAALLSGLGVEVPTKISPTTGQITYAFAKTDTGWKELEEEWADDPTISALLTARVSAKSTLEESRSQRLLDIAMRHTLFRVPLRYYAAHTGRYGGMELINAQNFPRIDKSRMRYAVKAPKGYVVLAADLAQIEARITAWLCKQLDLLQDFRDKKDIYASFAATAYGIPTTKGASKEDDKRRFVGKTCILGLGYGMSDARLRGTLRKDGVKLDLRECTKLVGVYRNKYHMIPGTWNALSNYINHMGAQANAKINFGPVTLAKNSVILPNGMALVYNNLTYKTHSDHSAYAGWVYYFAGEMRTLWGGKLLENIVQALARIIVMDNMVKIKQLIGLLPALQQHDELDYVVPVQYAEKIARVVGKVMRAPPIWAPDLPVEVEINYGPSLGDCK